MMTTPDHSALPPGLTPEMIERMRQTGIRLDREGRLWHEGREVTHQGLRRALLSWLDVRDDGRAILRLDDRRYAYIDVEDSHLLAVSARWDGDRAFLVLSDGSEEELDYASVRVADTDGAMYCKVRGGVLDARVTTPAYHVLAEHIEALPSDHAGDDDDNSAAGDSDSGYVLRAAGRVFPIGARGAGQGQ